MAKMNQKLREKVMEALSSVLPITAILLALSVTVVPIPIGTVLLFLAGALGELLDFLREIGAASGLSDDLFIPLYKTAGIALVVKVGGSLCRDAGESALASAVETAGTVCALLVSLPLLRAVLALLLELTR